MRTYGRITNPDGSKTWVEVDDYNGIYLTTLAQCLKLFKNESPFFANYGISANVAVIQQIWPDFDVALTQQQFAPFFASLIISKQNAAEPTYLVNVLTKQGQRKQIKVTRVAQ